jgi:ESX secretion system protein EccD
LPVSDPGLRRVSIYADSAVVDMALPSQIPVAALMPRIVDLVEGRATGSPDDLTARRYQLSRPGTPGLDRSMTLAQSGIRDGDVLVLNHGRAPVPAPRYHDPAEAVTATLDARTPTRPTARQAARLSGALAAGWFTVIGGLAPIRNSFVSNTARDGVATAGIAGLAGLVALTFATYAHRTFQDSTAGLTLGLIATAFAAVGGFLAVPGAPAAPHVLLAAMAAAVTSTLAMRVSGCGAVAFAAIACFSMAIAVAAVISVATGAPPRAISSVSTLVSLGLLGAAARLSIILAGLTPRLPATPDLDTFEPSTDAWSARAMRADTWLASLLAAFASCAGAGSIITVLAGAPKLNCIAFAALTGTLLLLRANSVDSRTLPCVVSGIAIIGTTLGIVAVGAPQHAPWIAATAILVALAVLLGFVIPAMTPSPVARRGIEVLECVALVALVPLTCWICGLYDAVIGLHPTWG